MKFLFAVSLYSLILSINCIDYEKTGINETNVPNNNVDSLGNFGQDTGKYGSVNIGAEYNPVKLTAGIEISFFIAFHIRIIKIKH